MFGWKNWNQVLTSSDNGDLMIQITELGEILPRKLCHAQGKEIPV